VYCERFVGTVFLLPNPDAIYSQDEEKEKMAAGHLVLFLFAHGPRSAMGSSEGQKEVTSLAT
jgi:hypothetical protein